MTKLEDLSQLRKTFKPYLRVNFYSLILILSFDNFNTCFLDKKYVYDIDVLPVEKIKNSKQLKFYFEDNFISKIKSEEDSLN